ncbi:DUF4382 domain-containing protein [Saccharospirillum salsuginis]|uniref:DUF4382 domain-containing protein n=1 Tax=Saccharospirillum salsuginis TaxID=418750 RepID=A0A918N929_9GAMM|nr:DUF4382 domain-containing protein [Saccharospirillum salsuginis]GGX50495.1 hypothetical protein GCM10007392_17070 [Saccharospirillum salsuginis]
MQRMMLTTVIGTAVLLGGCNPDWNLGAGRLSLAVTDAPVDFADSVVVVFTGVTLYSESIGRIELTFDEPKSIDLLDLQGGESAALLSDVKIQGGQYDWVRLDVSAQPGNSDSYIEIGGARYDLELSEHGESGLTWSSGLSVPVDRTAKYTVDFDLRQSIVHHGQTYRLDPSLRWIANAVTGGVSGTVSSGLVTGDCHGAVYAYAGSDVTPGDVGGEGQAPVTSAIVHTEATGTVAYDYDIGFLNYGEYTLSFTCEADTDDPESADVLNWSGTQNVTVTAGQITEAHFEN